jgi:hypothetical protein
VLCYEQRHTEIRLAQNYFVVCGLVSLPLQWGYNRGSSQSNRFTPSRSLTDWAAVVGNLKAPWKHSRGFSMDGMKFVQKCKVLVVRGEKY